MRRVALFGSALGDSFGPDSDVDLLVEFQPGVVRSLLDHGRIKVQFEDFFGRPVDLAQARLIDNPIRRAAILAQAEPIYVAAGAAEGLALAVYCQVFVAARP